MITAACDKFGIKIKVYTDQPGIQFYGGNFLEGSDKGKNGKAYEDRTALCLETQHFPDSPNHPQFPNTTLKPGETFNSVTSYRFPGKKKDFRSIKEASVFMVDAFLVG